MTDITPSPTLLPEGATHAVAVPPWRWGGRDGTDSSEVVLVAVASSLGAATTAGALLTPTKKNPWGSLGGIRSPPGLNTHEQDNPQEQEPNMG